MRETFDLLPAMNNEKHSCFWEQKYWLLLKKSFKWLCVFFWNLGKWNKPEIVASASQRHTSWAKWKNFKQKMNSNWRLIQILFLCIAQDVVTSQNATNCTCKDATPTTTNVDDKKTTSTESTIYAKPNPGKNTAKLICRNCSAVKLQQDFDALCEMISEFSSGHICACYWGIGHFHLDGTNLQM